MLWVFSQIRIGKNGRLRRCGSEHSWLDSWPIKATILFPLNSAPERFTFYMAPGRLRPLLSSCTHSAMQFWWISPRGHVFGIRIYLHVLLWLLSAVFMPTMVQAALFLCWFMHVLDMTKTWSNLSPLRCTPLTVPKVLSYLRKRPFSKRLFVATSGGGNKEGWGNAVQLAGLSLFFTCLKATCQRENNFKDSSKLLFQIS